MPKLAQVVEAFFEKAETTVETDLTPLGPS